MYPIANILPRIGMRPRSLETNVKSMMRSRRAMAFIDHDKRLWGGVLEDEVVGG